MFKLLNGFHKKLINSVFTVGFASISQTATASDDPVPTVAMQCLSCHSATGQPLLEDVPIIAGQQPVYLFNALTHYKNGTRTAGQALVMQEMVKNLSVDDLKILADWFGAQK